MPSHLSVVIRDNLSLTTWLLLGASLQSAAILLASALPSTLSTRISPLQITLIPALLLLLLRLVNATLVTYGITIDQTMRKSIRWGRFAAQLPRSTNSSPSSLPATATLSDPTGEEGARLMNGGWSDQLPTDPTSGTHSQGSAIWPPSKPAESSVVVFILGFRSTHPFGLLSPGIKEIGTAHDAMWDDAVANREKWGFLGKTSALLSTTSTASNAILSISYWRSMAHLQAFALGKSHREGWDWFSKNTRRYPHLGIMHETYSVPARRWENVYVNFEEWGMGEVRNFVGKKMDGEGEKEEGEAKKGMGLGYVSSLIEAKGSKWKSMRARMDQA
ncbi:hypothetical protein MMC25_008347 [Agyrium rufum]|nr:hypothetical protein [Agyrium rufum]